MLHRSAQILVRSIVFAIGVSDGAALRAQCPSPWVASPGFPGLEGPVSTATLWDPDGGGPAPAQLVVAGDFRFAGATPVSNLATYEFATGVWSTMGGATNGLVRRFLTLPSGELVAIGDFSQIGGVASGGVATWNGSTWQSLSTPSQTAVSFDGVILPNGDLVVGGGLSIVGGWVQRWNGTMWSTIASLPISQSGTGVVQGMAVAANGDLVFAGDFVQVAGVPANHIARWNGTAFQPLGAGLPAAPLALRVLANGDLLAANNDPAAPVRRWDGTAWSNLGTGLPSGTVRTLAVAANGDVWAAGNLPGVMRWNGAAWSVLAPSSGVEITSLLELPGGAPFLGGGFDRIGGTSVGNAAIWSGTAWTPLGPNGAGHPPFTNVLTLLRLPNGDLVAGGSYNRGQSVLPTYAITRNRVARWDGNAWSVLGDGSMFTGTVYVGSLAVLSNGDLVAGGRFANLGGVGAANLARWNGTAWLSFANGANDSVDALVVLPNGDLIAGGSFTQIGGVAAARVARWNGTSWSPIGSGFNGQVLALATWNGEIVAAGLFSSSGAATVPGVARWTGVAWVSLGTGVSGGYAGALLPLASGELAVGGAFTNAGGALIGPVARWNGASWSASGTGLNATGNVRAMVQLPNGDLVAAGNFLLSGGGPFSSVVRLSGSSWQAYGDLQSASTQLAVANTLAFREPGELWAGGDFVYADGVLAPFAARRRASCPASAVAIGPGCAGSGGANVLTATALPWLGATFRATASGLPVNGLAVVVWGATSAVLPLATVLPPALPGCTLWASPTSLQLALPNAGQLQTALPIPTNPALVGASLRHQVVAAELDAVGAIVALTASNGLELVAGAF